MSIWNPIIVERTTAATDLLIFFLGCYYCWRLYKNAVIDKKKRKYWTIVVGATALAGLFGAAAHGFHLSETTYLIFWQLINVSLGFVIAFFVQGAIHEKWGASVSDKTLPWIYLTAVIFYVFSVVLQGSFLIFIGYQGLGMLLALGIFITIYTTNRQRHILLMIMGIILCIIAAIVQGTHSLAFHFIWPFDHNSSFHLIQALATVFIFKSLMISLFQLKDGL